jgi:hypothetical protein
MVSLLLNSMPKEQNVPVAVKEVKLQFLRDTVGSKLFQEPGKLNRGPSVATYH